MRSNLPCISFIHVHVYNIYINSISDSAMLCCPAHCLSSRRLCDIPSVIACSANSWLSAIRYCFLMDLSNIVRHLLGQFKFRL